MLYKYRRYLTVLPLLVGLLLWPVLGQAGLKSTTYYDLDYGRWSGVGSALVSYLDAAFTTPAGLLGYNNQGHGKIAIQCYSDPRSGTLGYMNPGENTLYLNLYGGNSTSASYLSDYGDTVAHETTHILYYNKTGLADRYDLYSSAMLSDIWVAESMAFYVGDVAYPKGPRDSKAYIGSQLNRYSQGGAQRASWYDSGIRYDDGSASNLDYAQLEAVGQFLATYGDGKGLMRLTDYLTTSNNYEAALQYAFGKPSGQYGTASGSGGNTLYSEYIKYYYGSY
ncbi:MAG: hypothetical protein V1806_00850 [Pseudomonadota bacterium]